MTLFLSMGVGWDAGWASDRVIDWVSCCAAGWTAGCAIGCAAGWAAADILTSKRIGNPNVKFRIVDSVVEP